MNDEHAHEIMQGILATLTTVMTDRGALRNACIELIAPTEHTKAGGGLPDYIDQLEITVVGLVTWLRSTITMFAKAVEEEPQVVLQRMAAMFEQHWIDTDDEGNPR